MNTFIINAKLPSLNDVVAKNRANKYYANKFKQDIEELIGWEIRQALVKRTLKPIQKPCEVYVEWHESTKRRDADNIQSSFKFIGDALVKNRILKNDSRRYLKQIHHIIIDDKKDFVIVRLKEEGEA